MSKRGPMLSFRITDEEKERIENLTAQLIKRYPYLSDSAIYRELMGFTSTGLITDAMRSSLLPAEDDQDDIQEIIQPPLTIADS